MLNSMLPIIECFLNVNETDDIDLVIGKFLADDLALTALGHQLLKKIQ